MSPVITIVSAVLSGIFIVAAFVVISIRAKRAISRYYHLIQSALGSPLPPQFKRCGKLLLLHVISALSQYAVMIVSSAGLAGADGGL